MRWKIILMSLIQPSSIGWCCCSCGWVDAFVPRNNLRHCSAWTLSNIFSLSSSTEGNNDNRNHVRVIDDVAQYCGVKPATKYRSMPVRKRVARWTWRQRNRVLRVLHWRDALTPVDSCINLECLWWKALSTTDPKSPCYEERYHQWTFNMLPKISRVIVVNVLGRFHPRWIHALLEIRMAYLNQAIENEVRHSFQLGKSNIRVISLGAGYDTRLIRMLNDNENKYNMRIQEGYEFDLPTTMESKDKLVKERLLRRRIRKNKSSSLDENIQLPLLIGLDLNDSDGLLKRLGTILDEKRTDGASWHTIFVVEGVLMYLQSGKAAETLKICAEAVGPNGTASLCFADRLDLKGYDDGDDDSLFSIQRGLAEVGWILQEWAPNPNANAKHMGIARREHSVSSGKED